MAKITGQVATPSSRGVAGIAFRWYFEGDEAGSQYAASESSADGSFSFSISHSTLSETNVNVMVCPEKTSTGIDHEFQFQLEDMICAKISVDHLVVENVAFTDTSEFLVTGQVAFPSSTYMTSSNSCGSSGVEVCAESASDSFSAPPPPPVCCTTDSAGFYSLSLAHGSSVNIRPSLNNHTFSANEIYIATVESAIEGQDFVDTTVVQLAVSLHGGKCENYLGAFKVRVPLL